MTVGAVEAIADIGSGIFLRINDNLIAKPDLFTKLTTWDGFREGGANSIAALPVWSDPRGSSTVTRVLSPEQLRSITIPRIAGNSHIIIPLPRAKTVPLTGTTCLSFYLLIHTISRQIRIVLELKATAPTP